MRVVVNRVKKASVSVDEVEVGSCTNGIMILSCFKEGDSIKEVEYLAKKVANLRIFDDENGVMNKSIMDTGGSILSISQFTLYADASKGNRPSYIKALNGNAAEELYNTFNRELNKYVHTETGRFGSDMKITTTLDGPVTIIIDSK